MMTTAPTRSERVGTPPSVAPMRTLMGSATMMTTSRTPPRTMSRIGMGTTTPIAWDFLENVDAFPDESTQWNDTDGDGYGDNPNGTGPTSSRTSRPNGQIRMVTATVTTTGSTRCIRMASSPSKLNGRCLPNVAGNSSEDARVLLVVMGMGTPIQTPVGMLWDGADAFVVDASQAADFDRGWLWGQHQRDEPGRVPLRIRDLNHELGLERDRHDESHTVAVTWMGMGTMMDPMIAWMRAGPVGTIRSHVRMPMRTASATMRTLARSMPPRTSRIGTRDGFPDHASPPWLNNDSFPQDATQCGGADGDGYGDNPNGTDADAFPNDAFEWQDSDGDGFGDNEDACSTSAGNSTKDRKGCLDSDGDGWSNPDAFHGTDQGADTFATDATQHQDNDGDGYGDASNGHRPDACPGTAGTSTRGHQVSMTHQDMIQYTNTTVFGCEDQDGDSYSNQYDPCPYQYGSSWVDRPGCRDSDGDGIGDTVDPLPSSAASNATDWDEDGISDHSWTFSENLDEFPDDSTQWSDGDGDGYGDNPNGTNPDAFPNDASEWLDSDGDTKGDNGDACPTVTGNSTEDRAGCLDRDGDGWSDPDAFHGNDAGADAFPLDATQHRDSDRDGYGDDAFGNEPDACPTVMGTSTMGITITASTGDMIQYTNTTILGCEDTRWGWIPRSGRPMPLRIRHELGRSTGMQGTPMVMASATVSIR